jgi:glutathione S-transferase
MIIAMPATLLTAIATILALLVYIWNFMNVGKMRGKHGINAPATTGNAEFERAYRIQLNMVEQLIIFLPLLWLANAYFSLMPYLVGALGLIWVVGRVMYSVGYMADPAKRSTGFMVSAIATLALLVMAVIGIVQAFMVLNAA